MLTLPKKTAAWISVASVSLLIAGKLIVGFITGSVSILSDAAHSISDLIGSVIMTFSVHLSGRPPDRDHQYGHEKIENVSGVIEGLLVFGVAGWIIYEALNRLVTGVELQHLGLGAAVMATAAVFNLFVASILKRSARASRSVALEANATHLYTDVYTTAGVFAGLVIIMAGGRLFPGYNLTWLDPVIALGVALLILSAAYRITRKSFRPLMDAAASPRELSRINQALEEFSGRGVDFHQLRTRRAGPSLYVDLHMGCRPGVSLERGHGLSHELKARLQEMLPYASALIHVEPSCRIERVPDSDETMKRLRDLTLQDSRVCEVKSLSAERYRGELRVEADLGIEPEVTLAESHQLVHDLEGRLKSHFPELGEVVFGLHPAQGWQEAIHEEEKARIRELVGERESRLAGIHELEISSSGSGHRVKLSLGAPPSLPVAEAHRIARRLEQEVKKLFPQGAETDIHIEPCHENCDWCKATFPVKKK